MSTPSVEDFYAFRVGAMWRYFIRQHFSFWMICCYLFFEYFRPQAIYPAIDIIPWAQTFILGAFVGAVFDKSVKWVSSPMNVWLGIFALVIFLASLNAYNPEISKDHYIDFYSWFVIYFLIITIVNTKERFYIFAMVFLFCAAKIAIGTTVSWASRGFTFTSWGLMGPRGYFQNSGELAILMLTLFPVAFYLFQAMYKKQQVRLWEKALLFVFFVTPILTILGASSRGAQIALALTLALMYRKYIFKVRPLIGIAILATAISLLLPEEQKQRFTEIGEDRTSQQRILYLENGWDMMKDHPYLGVGYYNFASYYNLHYSHDLLRDRAEMPHNIFIQVGTDAGFIGLGVFMALILSALWMSFKVTKIPQVEPVFSYISAGLGYGILGFIVAGQFVTVAYYPFFWISAAMLVSLGNCCRSPEPKPLKRHVGHMQNLPTTP
ncbi:MAG: O-antigen ligase family protein [Cellvibrionaceae bacterium]